MLAAVLVLSYLADSARDSTACREGPLWGNGKKKETPWYEKYIDSINVVGGTTNINQAQDKTNNVQSGDEKNAIVWLVEPKITRIVSLHTDVRHKRVHATRMEELGWSGTLAEVVSNEARCDEIDRLITTKRIDDVAGFVSVARSSFSWTGHGSKAIDQQLLDAMLNGAIDDWADSTRQQAYNPANGHCTTVTDTDYCVPFKQVVWAATTAIACGFLTCPLEEATIFTHEHHFLCYYSPA